MDKDIKHKNNKVPFFGKITKVKDIYVNAKSIQYAPCSINSLNVVL